MSIDIVNVGLSPDLNSVITDSAIGGPVCFHPTTENHVIDALRRWLECSSLIDAAGIKVMALPKTTRLHHPGNPTGASIGLAMQLETVR